MEFVFLIYLIDLTNTKNVEHIKREGLFGTPLLTELQNGSFQDRHCKKAYDSALITTSFNSINSFSKKKSFNKNGLTSKIGSAASSGGEEKLTYLIYCHCSPLERGLSIFKRLTLTELNIAKRKHRLSVATIFI